MIIKLFCAKIKLSNYLFLQQKNLIINEKKLKCAIIKLNIGIKWLFNLAEFMLRGRILLMKRTYERPLMFAEEFVSDQYVAACKEPMYNVTPTSVRCESKGHENTQYITMFTDQQAACVALFVPSVGSAVGDKFKTKFEACAYVDGCNRSRWLSNHPNDTKFETHAKRHGVYGPEDPDRDGFINHDTTIDLSLAQKFNLS